tara:strand:- start:5174 stop:5443 length:270 start_codon:yes stop_codon:yes gene_type:complete
MSLYDIEKAGHGFVGKGGQLAYRYEINAGWDDFFLFDGDQSISLSHRSIEALLPALKAFARDYEDAQKEIKEFKEKQDEEAGENVTSIS